MKKVNVILSLVIATVFFVSSCSKDDGGTTKKTTEPVAGTMTAKVDGAAWTATMARGSKAMGIIGVVGSTGQGTVSIGVSMPTGITKGTYDLSGFGDYTAQYNKSGTMSLVAEDGKLTITKHDVDSKRIEGTFNFNASELSGSETAKITSGNFAVNY